MKYWMIERRFKLGDSHPTHSGFVTPIRGMVEAETEEEAKKGANQAAQTALEVMTTDRIVTGEWVGDAVVLYEIG